MQVACLHRARGDGSTALNRGVQSHAKCCGPAFLQVPGLATGSDLIPFQPLALSKKSKWFWTPKPLESIEDFNSHTNVSRGVGGGGILSLSNTPLLLFKSCSVCPRNCHVS